MSFQDLRSRSIPAGATALTRNKFSVYTGHMQAFDQPPPTKEILTTRQLYILFSRYIGWSAEAHPYHHAAAAHRLPFPLFRRYHFPRLPRRERLAIARGRGLVRILPANPVHLPQSLLHRVMTTSVAPLLPITTSWHSEATLPPSGCRGSCLGSAACCGSVEALGKRSYRRRRPGRVRLWQ